MKVKGKHRKPKKCSFFHLFHRVSLGSFKADGFEGFITKKNQNIWYRNDRGKRAGSMPGSDRCYIEAYQSYKCCCTKE